jgi:hypothetical protein
VLQRPGHPASDPVALWYVAIVIGLAAISIGVAIGAAVWR